MNTGAVYGRERPAGALQLPRCGAGTSAIIHAKVFPAVKTINFQN